MRGKERRGLERWSCAVAPLGVPDASMLAGDRGGEDVMYALWRLGGSSELCLLRARVVSMAHEVSTMGFESRKSGFCLWKAATHRALGRDGLDALALMWYGMSFY